MNSENTVQPEGSQTTQIGAGDQNLTGIRGWLIVVIIGCVATIILNLKNISEIRKLISQISGMSSSVASNWMPALYFELIVSSVIILGFVLALILMFSKKAFFPKYMITLYVVTAIFNITDILWAESLGGDTGSISLNVVKAILPCIIWCSYFTLSKRVKNTFVK
jgi:hypothetical protein